jgi:hypothetical protein
MVKREKRKMADFFRSLVSLEFARETVIWRCNIALKQRFIRPCVKRFLHSIHLDYYGGLP